MERSWRPVRKGKVYCSPACGRGCTIEEHREAVRKAEALCKKLGKGWKPVVHENLGWHFRATKAHMDVHYHGGKYWANLHGDDFPQVHATAITARGAVAGVNAIVQHMRNVMDRIVA